MAETSSAARPRVLTWHVHGSYLYYLSRVPCDFILPVRPGRPEGYGGRNGNFDWPANVREVPADQVPDLDIDLVLTQSARNYLHDRFELLSPRQLCLPLVHLEHDPPRESPSDTRHVTGSDVSLLVHVTSFNDLMWDSGEVPTRVIEHGVAVPEQLAFSGRLPRAITVVNELARRGRRAGSDVFERVASEVPVDLVGMGSEERGGLGDLSRIDLLAREADYRCFFHPIRYTSLGLAVIEAMMLGLPVVGLATTELVTVIANGRSGYIDTDVSRLVAHLRRLLADPDEAQRLGAAARITARERFSIERFAEEWREVFEDVASGSRRGSRQAGLRSGGREGSDVA